MILTDEDLAFARETQTEFLPQTATISRRSLSSDGAGGYLSSETTRTLPCRLAHSSHLSDLQIAGSVNETSVWRVIFEYGADVLRSDKISIGSRTFEILGILAGGHLETARVCICVER